MTNFHRVARHTALIGGVALLGLCSLNATAIGVDVKGFYTTKSLDKGDWGSDLATQSAYGVGVDVDVPVLPFDITAAMIFLNSSEERTVNGVKQTHELSGRELQLGILKGFAPLVEVIRPYLGGGITNSSMDYTVEIGNDKTTKEYNDTGYWGSAGVQVNFAGLQLSYDIRRAFYPEDSETKRGLSGSYQSFTFGYRF